MTDIREVIRANLLGVRNEIERACDRVDRSAADVQLIAVTKYAQPAWVDALLDEGIDHLGESRPQQMVERVESPQFDRVKHWHMIGHLQRNKVRSIVTTGCWIHSVDSLRLAETINRIASEEQARPRLLLQVNVSREDSKQGFAAEYLEKQWPAIAELPHLDVCGLMTMAPHTDDTAVAQNVFDQLRALRDRLNAMPNCDSPMTHLSMGMSSDFAMAIEAGASMIRIGSRLFQGLRSDSE